MGEPQRATELYLKALAAFVDLRDRSAAAHVCLRLALYCWALNDHSQAKVYFSRAQGLFESVGDVRGAKAAEDGLARL